MPVLGNFYISEGEKKRTRKDLSTEWKGGGSDFEDCVFWGRKRERERGSKSQNEISPLETPGAREKLTDFQNLFPGSLSSVYLSRGPFSTPPSLASSLTMVILPISEIP